MLNFALIFIKSLRKKNLYILYENRGKFCHFCLQIIILIFLFLLSWMNTYMFKCLFRMMKERQQKSDASCSTVEFCIGLVIFVIWASHLNSCVSFLLQLFSIVMKLKQAWINTAIVFWIIIQQRKTILIFWIFPTKDWQVVIKIIYWKTLVC